MDFSFDAKDEPFETYNGLASSAIGKPLLPTMSQQLPTVLQFMDALQSSALPPFLTKTYDMVDDPATDEILSWSSTNNSFVVWSPPDFSRDLLPKFFKHKNFSSFVRQLNTYGFRKVDPDRWEFANEGFLRGQRHLLMSIHRRKPAQSHSQRQGQGPSVEVSKFGGMEGEIERLKRDKNVLMFELVRIKQHHQTTEQKLRVMGQRLHATEQRQGQMMSFLAKSMQNPTFLAQLIPQSDNNKRYVCDRKKRRLAKTVSEGLGGDSGSDAQLVKPDVSSVNEHTHSRLVEVLSSSDALKKVDTPFVMVDRPAEAEERIWNSEEEDEYSSPGGQAKVSGKKMHLSSGAILRSSQVAGCEREHHYDSQVKAPLSAIPRSEDARGLEDRNLGGGESLPDIRYISDVERFQNEDVESGGFHNVLGMNDMFWEQFLGGKLDSGDSASDADGEKSSGSGSGDQDGEYAGSPWVWINKPNMDQLGFDFARRPLFSK